MCDKIRLIYSSFIWYIVPLERAHRVPLCASQQTDMSQAEPTCMAAGHVRNSRTQAHYLTNSIPSAACRQLLFVAAAASCKQCAYEGRAHSGVTYRMCTQLRTSRHQSVDAMSTCISHLFFSHATLIPPPAPLALISHATRQRREEA